MGDRAENVKRVADELANNGSTTRAAGKLPDRCDKPSISKEHQQDYSSCRVGLRSIGVDIGEEELGRRTGHVLQKEGCCRYSYNLDGTEAVGIVVILQILLDLFHFCTPKLSHADTEQTRPKHLNDGEEPVPKLVEVATPD